VATGAFIWSVCTVGVSMSTNLAQACTFTTMNGLGLALVIPCAQSLMADYFPAEQRGRAFGAMQLTMSFGSMVGSLFATNVAKTEVRSMRSTRSTQARPAEARSAAAGRCATAVGATWCRV
jgi:MFS family permease